MGGIRTTTEALPPALYNTEGMPHSVHCNRNTTTLMTTSIHGQESKSLYKKYSLFIIFHVKMMLNILYYY
jgi:hypothetical protein